MRKSKKHKNILDGHMHTKISKRKINILCNNAYYQILKKLNLLNNYE